MGLWEAAKKFGNVATLGAFSGSDGPKTDGLMGQQYADISQYGQNPYASDLKGMINKLSDTNFSAPTLSAGSVTASPISYTGGVYQAKDTSKMALPQYDAMRERLNSQYSDVQSSAQDALDRQFAAMGGGPGAGVQAKQTENLAGKIAAQKGTDLQTLNAQEAEARTALQQQEEQRAFQSGESAKGYGFQANLENSRQGLGAQEFNVGQASNMAQFNAQLGLTAQKYNADVLNDAIQGNTSLAALHTKWDEGQAEARNNEFNKAQAQWEAEHSGGLLGGGGFLGTGL